MTTRSDVAGTTGCRCLALAVGYCRQRNLPVTTTRLARGRLTTLQQQLVARCLATRWQCVCAVCVLCVCVCMLCVCVVCVVLYVVCATRYISAAVASSALQPNTFAICGMAIFAMPAWPSTPGCPPQPSHGGPFKFR